MVGLKYKVGDIIVFNTANALWGTPAGCIVGKTKFKVKEVNTNDGKYVSVASIDPECRVLGWSVPFRNIKHAVPLYIATISVVGHGVIRAMFKEEKTEVALQTKVTKFIKGKAVDAYAQTILQHSWVNPLVEASDKAILVSLVKEDTNYE